MIVRIRFGFILVYPLLADCDAATPAPDTAQLPPETFGVLDNDIGAANRSTIWPDS